MTSGDDVHPNWTVHFRTTQGFMEDDVLKITVKPEKKRMEEQRWTFKSCRSDWGTSGGNQKGEKDKSFLTMARPGGRLCVCGVGGWEGDGDGGVVNAQGEDERTERGGRRVLRRDQRWQSSKSWRTKTA